MIVISDTTPLISLMKIGRLELLHKLFGEIQIPEAVFNELVSNPRFPDESREIKSCPFIKVVVIDNSGLVKLLRRSTGLDLGESEAILLADSFDGSLLLMDEAKGRQVAAQMEISVMGTIGILMAGYKEGFLLREEIKDCVEILKKAGRHISDRLYRQLMEKISD